MKEISLRAGIETIVVAFLVMANVMGVEFLHFIKSG